MRRVILASKSPRRKELLAAMGVTFEVCPSNFEEHLNDARLPSEVAEELALGKANDVARKYPDAYVIGSDTIVVTAEGKQLEKPKDTEEAEEMLRDHAVSGSNVVVSGVALVCINESIELTGSDTTTVYFKPYDAALIKKYAATKDSLDKAGGYGIQSGAGELIESIEGCYDTVIGFPTHVAAQFLNEVGIAANPVEIKLPIKQKMQ